jgi:hypothetical protein
MFMRAIKLRCKISFLPDGVSGLDLAALKASCEGHCGCRLMSPGNQGIPVDPAQQLMISDNVD